MNIDDLKKIFYRKKVAGIIIGGKGEYLVNQLIDYKKDEWNFPGGGVDKGETEEVALLRELGEELGTDKFKILQKGKNATTYDWPLSVIIKRWINNKGIWRGQRVRYFLVKFTGRKSDIKPDPKEIRKIKWIKRAEFKDYLIFPNQLDSIENELKQF